VNLQPGLREPVSSNVIWVAGRRGLVVNMYSNFRHLQYYNTWSNWRSSPLLGNRRWYGKLFVSKWLCVGSYVTTQVWRRYDHPVL